MIPKIIAVDFDGTLCNNCYPKIGEANTSLIEYLKNLHRFGNRLILWTCRTEDRLAEAIKWCANQGLIFDAVNENLPDVIEKFGSDTRKVFANEYIDDRNSYLVQDQQQLMIYLPFDM